MFKSLFEGVLDVEKSAIELYARNAFERLVSTTNFVEVDLNSGILESGSGYPLKGGALNVITGVYIYVRFNGLAITFQRGGGYGGTYEQGAVLTTESMIDKFLAAYIN